LQGTAIDPGFLCSRCPGGLSCRGVFYLALRIGAIIVAVSGNSIFDRILHIVTIAILAVIAWTLVSLKWNMQTVAGLQKPRFQESAGVLPVYITNGITYDDVVGSGLNESFIRPLEIRADRFGVNVNVGNQPILVRELGK
jgi:hypothetical protein